jgi:hypothetical protein
MDAHAAEPFLLPPLSLSLSLELRGECDFAALILGECAAAYIKNASARREMSFFPLCHYAVSLCAQ